jgi:competence protein ComEA
VLLRDKFVLGGAAASLVLMVVAGWLLVSPLFAPSEPGEGPLAAGGAPSGDPLSTPEPTDDAAMLVIDVEGGVAEPGIQQLPEGSRIADALVAAGGYSTDADIAGAARQLNLASSLSDGQQIYVPRIGDAPGSSGGTGASSGSGGLVNLNQATPEELDALPGIGPVTVQKIVAARQEQPFRTLDELVERKVLTASQLDKVRDQVSV